MDAANIIYFRRRLVAILSHTNAILSPKSQLARLMMEEKKKKAEMTEFRAMDFDHSGGTRGPSPRDQ